MCKGTYTVYHSISDWLSLRQTTAKRSQPLKKVPLIWPCSLAHRGILRVSEMFRQLTFCCGVVSIRVLARLTIFLRQIAASFVNAKTRKERHDHVHH